MSPTLIIIAVAVIVAAFIFILLYDGPSNQKRQDDRDKIKADEINRNPALLDQSQQAAELQVGEEREVRQPSRFSPDAKANEKSPTPVAR
jgi:hypothetical protein